MNICSMVIDNLEFVDYRVGYSSSRMKCFDRFVWFGSDKFQCEMLEEKKKRFNLDNVDIINSEHKIKNGDDFAILQEKSYYFIKENYDYDVLCFLSADELLTDFGQKYLVEWVDSLHESFCVFYAMSNKMFCETHLDPICFQVIRKGVTYKTNGGKSDNLRYCDGEDITTNSHHYNLGTPDEEDKNLVIDFGYLNPLACYRKMINWNRLCYSSAEKIHLIDLFNSGDVHQFILKFFEYHRKAFHGATDKKIKTFEFKGEYKRLIKDLNMTEDFKLVQEIVSEL